MRERRGERLTGSGVPDARGVVPTGSDDAGAVGAERGAPHDALMLERWGDWLAGSGIPERAVLSSLEVTTRVPSGLNTALHTAP